MVLGFLKKKKEELPLPPPPPLHDALAEESRLQSEIPDIRLRPLEEKQAPPMLEQPPALSQPSLPQEVNSLPEAPLPSVVEAPSFPELKPVAVKEVVPVKQSKKVFDKTLREDVLSKKPVIREPAQPLFVSVDDYRAIIEGANVVRSKLLEADETVRRITELKSRGEREFDRWRKMLEDVEKKMSYVEAVVAKASA